MRNKNNKVIHKLAAETYRKNRMRNRILIFAVAVGIVAIFSILTLISGKIDAIYLTGIRTTGDVASVFLEKPSAQLCSQVKELEYISDVGGEWDLGTILAGNAEAGWCVYSDETKFHKIDTPAYTDLAGNYPRKRNEVMLSKHSLKLLGIQDPRIGQAVNLTIAEGDDRTYNRDFVLSGYFTNYTYEEFSRAYFSGAYALERAKDTGLPEYLYLRHKDTISLEKAEKMLYRDLHTKSDTQQFLVSDTAEHRAVAQTVGGYGQGAVCGMLILLCIFLLIYNVMNISLRNEMHFYGQLKTIGIDRRDMIRTILLQMRRILLWGMGMGAAGGSLLSLFLIPKLISSVYLYNYGPAADMMGFRIEFLLLSLLFVGLVTLVSAMLPVWKIAKMSPIEAMRYTGKAGKKKGYTAKKRKALYLDIALKNLRLDKGKSALVILSVAIGIIFAQCAMILINGLDQTNQYAFMPDFYISNGNAPLNYLNESGYSSDTNTINGEMVEQIKSIDGVREVKTEYADYVKFDVHDRSWYPMLKVANANLGYGDNGQVSRYIRDMEGDFEGSIAILTEAEIGRLEAYARKNNFPWDMEGLRNGKVALNATSHIFTAEMQEKADQVSGEPITVYSYDGKKQGRILFGGYMDMEKKGFPINSKKAWGRKEQPSLFVSEKGYRKLNLEKKVHRLEVNVDQTRLAPVTEQVHDIVEQRNLVLKKEFQHLDIENILLTDKAEIIKQEENRMFMSKVVMYTIAGILICMGIINFVNAVMTSIISLKREYTMMEVIGMERKQLQRIVTCEGLCFALLVLLLVFSLGSLILYGVHTYTAGEYPYYRFAYPAAATGIIVISMILFSLAVPYLTLRSNLKDSTVDRLRKVL